MSEFENKYESAIKRFWSWVLIRDDINCWPWLGGMRTGYGAFFVEKRTIGAHRFSLEIELDRELGPKECACHRCDNRECVSPFHLFVGSLADNSSDMVSKDREASGERSGNSIITNDKAREIYTARVINKESLIDVATKYDVTVAIVSFVACRKTWRKATAEISAGIEHGRAIATPEVVRSVYRDILFLGMSRRDAAERNGVSYTVAGGIAARRLWKAETQELFEQFSAAGGIEKSRRSNLTGPQAIGIYNDFHINKMRSTEIAAKYDVGVTSVFDIAAGRSWAKFTGHKAAKSLNN